MRGIALSLQAGKESRSASPAQCEVASGESLSGKVHPKDPWFAAMPYKKWLEIQILQIEYYANHACIHSTQARVCSEKRQAICQVSTNSGF